MLKQNLQKKMQIKWIRDCIHCRAMSVLQEFKKKTKKQKTYTPNLRRDFENCDQFGQIGCSQKYANPHLENFFKENCGRGNKAGAP